VCGVRAGSDGGSKNQKDPPYGVAS
jgi:hypothetical protein